MTQTEEKNASLFKIVSIVSFIAGLLLVAYTATRLGHGPFPFSSARIFIIICGICLMVAGWITRSPQKRQALHDWAARTAQSRPSVKFVLETFFSPICEQSYPRAVRALLTFLMFAGISMVFWAMLKPPVKLGAQCLHRYEEMGLGGIALALSSGVLRHSKKSSSPGCGKRIPSVLPT